VLSSHLLGDLERVCDHLIVLAAARVQLAGDVTDLLAVHYRVTGTGAGLPAGAEVIHAEHTARETTVIVRSTEEIPGADHADLEDVGLAYMTRAAEASVFGASGSSPTTLEAQR